MLYLTKRKYKLEADFQKDDLIPALRKVLPDDAVILKNDPNHLQGYPDLTLHYKGAYILLEVKRYKGASEQPNQRYYIEQACKNTYAAFVYPENMEEVIHEVQRTFASVG